MNEFSATIWSQGLFLKPEHLQQENRYNAQQRAGLISGLVPYAWGLADIEVDRNVANKGKFSLVSVRGIMPGGLVFDSAIESCLPDSLVVSNRMQDTTVYLAINTARHDVAEIDADIPYTRRFKLDYSEAKDRAAGIGGDPVNTRRKVSVAVPHLFLSTSVDVNAGIDAIAIARIKDVDTDGNVIIDEEFVPTSVSVKCSAFLVRFLTEIQTELSDFYSDLQRIVGMDEENHMANFWHPAFSLLGVVARCQRKFNALGGLAVCHPSVFYALCADTLIEIDQFALARTDVMAYQHAYPTDCFQDIRRLLLERVRWAREKVETHNFSAGMTRVGEQALQEESEKDEVVKRPKRDTPSAPPW